MSANGPRTHEDAPGSPSGVGAESGQGGGPDRPSEGKYGVREGLNSVGVPKLSGAEGLRTLAAGRIMPDGTAGEHTVPYGARDQFARQVQALVADNKNAMLAELNKPEVVRSYLEAIEAGAKRKDRTCIRMLHEIYDLAGVKNGLVMAFLARVGAESLEEVEVKVNRVKDAQAMDPHQRAAACADYLDKYFSRHPEMKSQVVRRFGVELPVTSDSFAVVDDET